MVKPTVATADALSNNVFMNEMCSIFEMSMALMRVIMISSMNTAMAP